jgi:hypothetical protein
MADELMVECIDRERRVAILTSGEVLPMRVLLDHEGDDTEDMGEAVFALCPMEDGRWATVSLRSGRDRVLH